MRPRQARYLRSGTHCLGCKRSSLNPTLDSLVNAYSSYRGNRGRRFLLKSLNCHDLMMLASNVSGWTHWVKDQ